MASLEAPDPGSKRTHLRLYVAGESTRSRNALENLRRLVDSGRPGPCEVEVVDVLEHPELAERERILATPTLLKVSPAPRRRIIGDLFDAEQVLMVVAPHRMGQRRDKSTEDRTPLAPDLQ